MKNTHERFDDELRRRLLNYTEDPDNDLWKRIAHKIAFVNPHPGWKVWSIHVTIAVSVLVISLFKPTQIASDERASLDQSIGDVSSIGMGDRPLIHQHADFEVSEETEPKESEMHHTYLAPAVNGQPAGTDSVDKFQFVIKNLSTSAIPKLLSEHFSPSHFHNKSKRSGNEKALFPDNSVKKKRSDQLKRKLRRYKPFSLYFMAMPTFGYQRIASNTSDKVFIENMKRVPTFSADRVGIGIAAGVEVPISKRWIASGGVFYYHRKQTIRYTEKRVDTLVFAPDPGGGIFMEPKLRSSATSIQYELRNAGLQAGMSYRLWMKTKKRKSRDLLSTENPLIQKPKLLHLVGGGIEFHKSLKPVRASEGFDGFSDPSMYVFFNLYYRIQYPDAGRLRAIFQPTLNYSFYISETLNAPFFVKPYGLGLNFGCTYNFR